MVGESKKNISKEKRTAISIRHISLKKVTQVSLKDVTEVNSNHPVSDDRGSESSQEESVSQDEVVEEDWI